MGTHRRRFTKCVQLTGPLVLAAPFAAFPLAHAEDPPPKLPPGTARQEAVDAIFKEDDPTNPYVLPGEIVVTAKSGAVPLTFAHGRDIIDHKTLETYPQGSITEALRQTPGVFIQSDAGNDVKMSIGIRGQQARVSSFTAILVDGIPVKQTLYGVVDLDIFPFTFERAYSVDIIRGGADLRYGPNAYGGVINFVTAPIPERTTVRQRFGYGSDGEYSTLTEAGGTWEGFGVLVTGVKKGGDGWRDNSEYHQEDGAAKFQYRFDDQNTLRWSLSRFVEEVEFASGITQRQFEDDPKQSRARDFGRGDVNRYNAQFEHTFSQTSALDIVAWYHESYREFSLAQPVLPPFARQNHQPANYEHRGLEGRFSWEAKILGLRHRFFHSARFYNDKTNRYNYTQPYEDAGAGPKTIVTDADFTTDSFAVFNEDTISLTDNLDLAVGFRSEEIQMGVDNLVTGLQANRNYSLSLPEASLSWRVLPQSALFASYSEGFGTPLYSTMDPSSPAYNPELEPEDAENKEIGFRTREWAGFESSATYFRQEYDNKIERSLGSDGITRFFNTQGTHVEGLELAFSYDLGGVNEDLAGLAAYANATWQESVIDHGSSGPGFVDDLQGKHAPNAPRELLNVGVRYRSDSGVWARIGRNHTGRYFSDALNSNPPSADGVNGIVPAFTIWDASVGWNQRQDGTGLSVSIGCTNLFDNDDWFRRNVTGIQPGAPRRFNATVGFTLEF